MSSIPERFPRFSLAKLVTLTELVVRERNAVGEINSIYKDCGLGFAILACQVVRKAVERRALSGEHEWLRFVGGAGLAYTVLLDGVPLRIQPDVPEIRDVLPAEEVALQRGVQSLMFPADPSSGAVLRLEIDQQAGKAVASVILYMLDPISGATIDRIAVYDGESKRYAETERLERPAQDVDTSKAFTFKPANDVKKKDGK